MCMHYILQFIWVFNLFKTGHHDIAEILMKVALNTKTEKQTNKHITVVNDVHAFVYQKMLNICFKMIF